MHAIGKLTLSRKIELQKLFQISSDMKILIRSLLIRIRRQNVVKSGVIEIVNFFRRTVSSTRQRKYDNTTKQSQELHQPTNILEANVEDRTWISLWLTAGSNIPNKHRVDANQQEWYQIHREPKLYFSEKAAVDTDFDLGRVGVMSKGRK